MFLALPLVLARRLVFDLLLAFATASTGAVATPAAAGLTSGHLVGIDQQT